jgi:hypothetical protein
MRNLPFGSNHVSRWLDVDADGMLEPRGDPAIAVSKTPLKTSTVGSVGDPVVKRTRAVRALRSLPLGLMAATVFVTYAAIVWTLRRGFDWTDESFVYTMIASNRMAVGEPWGFQHLLHPLYIMTGESVLAFRIVRLVGYVLLSVALVWCARAVVSRMGISIPRSGWAFILILAQVGTFFAWSYPPRYLSYNELGSWLVQLGVALIVLSLAWGVSSPHDQRAARALGSIWVGLGTITTLLVFAKVTSGVVFGAFLMFALVIPNPNMRLWKRVLAAGAGTSIVLCALWVCRYPMGFYLKNAFALLFDKSAQNTFNHPISGLIQSYVGSVLATGYALLPALLLFTIMIATFRRKVRPIGALANGGTADRVRWILGFLLILSLTALTKFEALTALTRAEMWSYLGHLIVFIGAAGVIGLMTLGPSNVAMSGSAKSRSFSVAIGGSAIVAAPFMSALGTNNSITDEFVFAATLWSVVLGIALVLLTQQAELLHSSTRSLPALIGCFVILMTALAVRTDIGRPYRSTSLLSQDTSTSVPELRGLLLTGSEAAWIDWVSAAGDSLGAEDVPAIAMNSPGALYAFNHSGYADPWIAGRYPFTMNSLRLACTTHPPADLFVLQPGISTKDDLSAIGLTRSLAECGIEFPSDFRVVDRRVSAEPALAMTVWRLKSR